ncbi:MAG: hypothetical protein HZA00_10595 [Nitrospinae bacterium]|nr:hypothetical protein [Nitrospinota bacterium]
MNIIKQISIAVLLVLLLTISVQAAEISVEINIEKYSDDISTAVKEKIDYNEVLSKALSEDKSENEKVKDDKVKIILNSTKEAIKKSSHIKLDKAQEDNIIDILSNVIPKFIDEYELERKEGFNDEAINKLRESVAVAIRTAIINSFASRAEMKFKKEIENINEKLDRLETAKKPKMIRPNKEVDFLFEAVVGDTYTTPDSDKHEISKIKIGSFWTTVTFNLF